MAIWGREEGVQRLPHYSPSLREARGGTAGRNRSSDHRRTLITGLLSLLFLYYQKPLSSDASNPSGLRTFTSIIKKMPHIATYKPI